MKKVVLAALLAFSFSLTLAGPVWAEHPDNDIVDRDNTGTVPPADGSQDDYWDPICDGENDGGHWESLDWEFWECVPEPGLPGVPGSGGFYWEPWDDPQTVLGGDVKFTVKWGLTNIPGVGYRLSPRTEWLNTTGAGKCPNVTGGCKLKGGADVHLFNSNGTPHAVPVSWLNNAKQIYVWNATTKVWDKKYDGGWRQAATSGTASKMTSTLNAGTAPYGAAYYYVAGWERTWNGAAYSTPVGVNSGYIWDAKPGDNTRKPAKPKKLPKIEPPVQGGLVASATE